LFKEEEREITPELLTELSRTLLSRSEAVINVILDLVSMREKIRNKLWEIGALRRLPDYPQKEIVGYAIDSSFVQALPLVVGDFFLVTAGYIRYPRLPTHLKERNAGLKVGVRLSNTMITSMRIISSYAHTIERKIGLDLVRKEEGINTILIDGPILPLYLYYIPREKLYDEEKQLIDATEELIRESKDRGVSLVGVVKRVRSRFIPKGFRRVLEPELGDKYVKMLDISNDKSLGALIMMSGEAVLFGKLGVSGPAYEAIITEEGFGRLAKRFIDSHVWANEMEFAIMKPKRSRQVISVEVLDYGNLGFENILTWINAHATHTGCPQILDYVDRYVQITSGLIEIARRLLIKIIAQKVRDSGKLKEFEIIELLLDYADLQKKFAPSMG